MSYPCRGERGLDEDRRSRAFGPPVRGFPVSDRGWPLRRRFHSTRAGPCSCAAVAAGEAGLLPGAPAIWDEAPENLSYRFQRGDEAATRVAFAAAAHIVEIDLVNNRLVPTPIEPRAAIGNYDAAAGRFDLLLTG